MTEEFPQAASQEPPSKPQPRELYSKALRALYAESGGRARKRRAARRARGNAARLAQYASGKQLPGKESPRDS